MQRRNGLRCHNWKCPMTKLTTFANLTKKVAFPAGVIILIGIFVILIVLKFIGIKETSDLPQLARPQIESLPPVALNFIAGSLSPPKDAPKKLPVFKISPGDNFLARSKS